MNKPKFRVAQIVFTGNHRFAIVREVKKGLPWKKAKYSVEHFDDNDLPSGHVHVHIESFIDQNLDQHYKRELDFLEKRFKLMRARFEKLTSEYEK
jgi:hypothetical protein